MAGAGVLADWKLVKEFDSGGQGRVSLVVPTGKDPIQRIIEPLNGLIPGMNSEGKLELLRRRFGDALLDFVQGRYGFGALKQLTRPTEQARARLALEAQVYETVSDPHLLKILDKNIDENWIVTAYQPNGTLEAKLETFKAEALKALLVIRPVVNVLAKLHDAHFTHRDFKPDNIFIGIDGQFVLGDAGLAFYEDSEKARVTKTYENVGTREYMPPWAYAHKSEIRPTFDLFSVGKVIWAMIAGRPACPLWWVFKDDFDLMTLFPDMEEMYWINKLLRKCVVEEEKDMEIGDGSAMLKEIDSTIDRIDARGVPPERAIQVGRTCRLCYAGTYEDHTKGYAQAIGTCLRCNRCGHLEFFDTNLEIFVTN